MSENDDLTPAEPPALHPTPLPPKDQVVDETGDESFPASDPPSYPAASASRSQDTPPPGADPGDEA